MLLALVAVVTLVAAACEPPYPQDDAFYTPPSPLGTGKPGDIIRSRPAVFTLDPIAHTPALGVKSTQILYRSTDALGNAIAVSGTVLVPTTPWLGSGPRPLVTYGVGTRGIGDSCAPSYTLTQGTDYEGLFIKGLLDQGWAVAVSDMQGLGTPGLHTYVVGKAEGRALLDAARAAQRLPGSGLSSTTPVGIMGYSQGGGSAGWAAQLAASYAPDLKVKGTVAGGVPADLMAVAAGDDGGAFVALVLMASIGYDAAYPELDLEKYLNAKGKDLYAGATQPDGICIASFDGIQTVLGTAFTHVADYVSPNPLSTPAWQSRLNENKLGATKPSAPVFQFHGAIDEMVPTPQAAKLRKDWCAKGATVDWTLLPGEHVLSMVEGNPLGVTWMGARFAGLPTLGNCWLP